ncbi:dentin sialophosphoprotein-like [Hyaena hyaena]|uniref:dentin sialophosphoprotein-like n=1 Tax=Hyaena hyaena TaxID=95912 RepID=UPI001923965F|nr:dentin sialophosphoprotein-like [Hyaena hyaena]
MVPGAVLQGFLQRRGIGLCFARYFMIWRFESKPGSRYKTQEKFEDKDLTEAWDTGGGVCSLYAVSRTQFVRYLSDDKILRFKEVFPTLNDNHKSQQKLKKKHSHSLSSDPNTFMDNEQPRNRRPQISVCKSHCKDYHFPQSFQNSQPQINPLNLLISEDYTSKVSIPLCHPMSMNPQHAVHPKTHRNNTYSLDTEASICSKYLMEISNSLFHKCLVNSNDDSDPDSSLPLQFPLGSKYSLNLKSIRHHKTSRNSPLSQSMDPKHPVGIGCPLRQDDSKYSLDSTSYLHCESSSAVQDLIDSTAIHTFPMSPQNTMGSHSTPDPDNVLNTSNVPGLENEGKCNLTAKLENEANPDNDTNLISARNLKEKASARDKPLLKDDTDHEDETDSEEEKDSEDEIDSENENNRKDKKDPKDKSDPDDSDSKDSNAENNADTNNGSDPGGDADPTSGADSNNDGHSNNGAYSNSELDSNFDDATNSDANSIYSTDSDVEKHTINSDNTSGLNNGVDQDSTANSSNGTNTNSISGLQNGTGLNYTSCSSNSAGARNATGSGNDICPHNGNSPSNRPGSKVSRSGLQNNAPDFQNIVSHSNSLDSSNNDSSQKINGPGLYNNSPGPSNNSPGLKIDPGSNYNIRPTNATSHNNSISSNEDADSKHDTKPTIATDHDYAVVPNYDSDLDYVSGFTHAVGSSLLVNPNYIAKNSYAVRHSSTATTVNFIDTSNTISRSGAISSSYAADTSCASGINHDPRLIHAFESNFVTNPNYDATDTHNVHNSTSTSNIHNLSKPELEISTSSSIPNMVCANSPTFAAGTNYTSTPKNLITSEFSDSSVLGINYTIFDNHKFGTCLKDSAGSMDSSSFNHATESKDVLDAKEVDFLKDISRIQNPISIKYPADLNFHSNSNIPLPSFDITIEAEPPDVVKFGVSSGAVNLFLSGRHAFWEFSV